MNNGKMPAEGTTMEGIRENVRKVKDEAKTAIADDRPLDKHAPGATFSLVFLSYLVGLFLAASVLGLVYWFFF
jgi:hypothetical protein